jgi:hypothetical protein
MFWERYFSLVLAAFNAAFYVEIDAGSFHRTQRVSSQPPFPEKTPA